MSDEEMALRKLRALTETDAAGAIHLTIDGAPASKARARYSKATGRFYTPDASASAEEAIAWRIKALMHGEPLTASVAIVAIFYRPDLQRIDADNLMKLVMDGLTKGGAWIDDCYVIAQAGFMEFDALQPRTVIAFCPASSSLDRGFPMLTCQRCGEQFQRAYRRQKPPQFCSSRCRYNAERRMARCARCNTEFMRTYDGSTVRYCSRECMAADPLRRRALSEQRPWPKCEGCGGRVSRREYMRCRDCSPKGRTLGSKNRPKIAA